MYDQAKRPVLHARGAVSQQLSRTRDVSWERKLDGCLNFLLPCSARQTGGVSTPTNEQTAAAVQQLLAQTNVLHQGLEHAYPQVQNQQQIGDGDGVPKT